MLGEGARAESVSLKCDEINSAPLSNYSRQSKWRPTCHQGDSRAGCAVAGVVAGNHTDVVVLGASQASEGASEIYRVASLRVAIWAGHRGDVGVSPTRTIPGSQQGVCATLLVPTNI